MLKRKDIIEYSGLSFEDFLLDDFFVQSNLYPTEESDLFWEKFEQENKGKLDNYMMAKKGIHELNKNVLDDQSVTKIWENIRKATHPAKSKRYYRIALAVAAGIAVLLVLRIFLPQKENPPHHQDIMTFAQRTATITDSLTTQLILSDDRVISLLEKESVIVYDSASIKLSSRKITKEETSAFHQLIIPKGKRLFLTLSDGTKIWANSGTKLIYPVEFEQKKREIYVDGEIFLDVATKNDHPFIVRTSDMNVEVLGTKFNVEAYNTDIQKRVALQSGSVKVHAGANRNIVLQPDEMFEKMGDRETVTVVDVAQYISWVEGVYIFDNERLDVVFARLSRHYGQEIIVDKAVANLKCSGKLDLKDKLTDVLKIIRFVTSVNFTCQDNKYIIAP